MDGPSCFDMLEKLGLSPRMLEPRNLRGSDGAVIYDIDILAGALAANQDKTQHGFLRVANLIAARKKEHGQNVVSETVRPSRPLSTSLHTGRVLGGRDTLVVFVFWPAR